MGHVITRSRLRLKSLVEDVIVEQPTGTLGLGSIGAGGVVASER